MSTLKPTRRSFLATSAIAAGSAMTMTASSYAKVKGANDNVRVGFLGVGGRCQQHVDVVLKMQQEGKNVVPVAVCDVWDGDQELGRGKGRGLYPTAKRCKIEAGKQTVSKFYEHILDNKDVDVACIAAPDHWHAKMALDAMAAGKDVYCEKPMTRTIAEAQAMVNAAVKNNTALTVGVQSMADPTWEAANKYITEGNLGHVFQGQTSYYRNSIVGQWRYYPLKKDMTPTTIDWRRFLGCDFDVDGVKLGPTPEEMPFDRALWAQWRCYWPFGGGMYTDLFVHQTTHLIAAMGVRYPARVVGGGGIFLEYDGRDVPDVATVVADYNEGCQVIISATMCNDTQLGEIIRGRLGTLKFVGGGDYINGFEVYAQNISGGPAKPAGGFSEPIYKYENPMAKSRNNATYALWEDFIAHVRMGKKDPERRKTKCPVELGAAAFCTVNMGVQSYRFDKVMYWDKDKQVEKVGDGSWSKAWEKRSKERGKPNQVIGWKGGDKGSVLIPPDYQKLEGPWIDGKDPAKG